MFPVPVLPETVGMFPETVAVSPVAANSVKPSTLPHAGEQHSVSNNNENGCPFSGGLSDVSFEVRPTLPRAGIKHNIFDISDSKEEEEVTTFTPTLQ